MTEEGSPIRPAGLLGRLIDVNVVLHKIDEFEDDVEKTQIGQKIWNGVYLILIMILWIDGPGVGSGAGLLIWGIILFATGTLLGTLERFSKMRKRQKSREVRNNRLLDRIQAVE